MPAAIARQTSRRIRNGWAGYPASSPASCRRSCGRGASRSTPLTFDHALAAGQLPGPHRDPWDRLIIAQALAGGVTVVTVDAVSRDYGVPVCW